jgi:hypothetical protein
MQRKRHLFLAFLVVWIMALAEHPSADSNIAPRGGPAVYWFMQEVKLEAPEIAQPDNMFWIDTRPFNVDVNVSVDFHYKNDDGSQGEFLGTTTEGTSHQIVRFGDVGDHANELGDRLGYAAAGLAGQEVGYQLSQRAADAARTAASQANPLSPSHQWGNWFADMASSGRNFLGRTVGALGGII